MTIDQIMHATPIIPVMVLEGQADWAKLTETFVEAGLPVLEVTLRTPAALDAIRDMGQVPGAIVGAGTVLNERQLEEAVEAGSRFIVSPGLTEPLAKAVIASGVPYLPGVATAGDIMRGLDLGLDRFKFFPAEPSGGIPAIKALSAPFSQVRFCPTGGIKRENVPEWLAIPSVICVGGSWLYQAGDDIDAIAGKARAAGGLRQRG